MKPVIDPQLCFAQELMCEAMPSCHVKAIYYVKDNTLPMGGRIVINYDLCDACGACAKACCGEAISMQETEALDLGIAGNP